MLVENLIVCPDRELDVRTSNRVIGMLKGMMGIYQTSHKLMNESCHALKVKYDPENMDEEKLRLELEGMNTRCNWRICHPGKDGCKHGCMWQHH